MAVFTAFVVHSYYFTCVCLFSESVSNQQQKTASSTRLFKERILTSTVEYRLLVTLQVIPLNLERIAKTLKGKLIHETANLKLSKTTIDYLELPWWCRS